MQVHSTRVCIVRRANGGRDEFGKLAQDDPFDAHLTALGARSGQAIRVFLTRVVVEQAVSEPMIVAAWAASTYSCRSAGRFRA